MNRPELLAPAGNLEKLKMAVTFGADAVYLGGREFSLRQGADNFSTGEMAEGISFAHTHGAKVYAAVNVFAHNEDLENLTDYFLQLEELQVDGMIISDPGVLRLARQIVPKMPVHISTQANNTNWSTVLFWAGLGIKRVVLARELSLTEISEIAGRANSCVELEAFVHGAMCMSYSGRCLLSNYLSGRDANRGDCAQPCRWKYYLTEEKRPGEFMPVEEDHRGTYIFNAKDLCLLEYLPALINAGITSLKIEGRMKSAYYVAAVVKVYREAIDALSHGEDYFAGRISRWKSELIKVSHRDYSTGFLFGKPKGEAHRYRESSYLTTYDFVGLVRGYDQVTGEALLEQRNRFSVGDRLEFVPPRGEARQWTVERMKDAAGEEIRSAPHPQQMVLMPVPFPLVEYTLVRRAVNKEAGDDER